MRCVGYPDADGDGPGVWIGLLRRFFPKRDGVLRAGDRWAAVRFVDTGHLVELWWVWLDL